MPNAQVIQMDGVGHLPMVEAPARTAADYLRFRAQVESVSPSARGAIGANELNRLLRPGRPR